MAERGSPEPSSLSHQMYSLNDTFYIALKKLGILPNFLLVIHTKHLQGTVGESPQAIYA